MSELIIPYMKQKISTSIFKDLSTGLSYYDHYREKNQMIAHFECSPNDGVELIIRDEKRLEDSKILFRKWLTLNDLETLQMCIKECIDFYNNLDSEETND